MESLPRTALTLCRELRLRSQRASVRGKPLFLLLCSVFFVLFTARSASAQEPLDLLNYFFPEGAPGTPISSGEFFKPAADGEGSFRINKSTSPAFYEKFRYDSQNIYHVEDTTWATQAGDVTCAGTNQTATLTYQEGEIGWVKRFMQPGECTTFSGTIIGRNEVTGQSCSTAYSGPTTRTICLRHQGCVSFPNRVTSDDSVVLEIGGGAGVGEQFIYDRARGWIGFNRGSSGTGAYATEQLSSRQYQTDECYEVKVTPGEFRCNPAVATCIREAAKVYQGGSLTVEKQSGIFANIRSFFSRFSEPSSWLVTLDQEQLKIPNISIFSPLAEAVPALSPHGFDLNVTAEELPGQNFNPGCNVSVDGQNVEGVELKTTGVNEYKLNQEQAKDLARLAFFEAVSKSGEGVHENIHWEAPDNLLREEEGNRYLGGNCPAQGITNEGMPVAAAGTVSGGPSFVERILDRLGQIASSFLSGFTSPSDPNDKGERQKTAVIRQTYSDLNVNSWSEKSAEMALNLYNSRLPAQIARDKDDAFLENRKRVTASETRSDSVGTRFPGYREVLEAQQDWLASFYPASIQGEAIKNLSTTPALSSVEPGKGTFAVIGEPRSSLMKSLIAEAAAAFNVPPEVLAAVAWTEGAGMWGWSDSEVITYSAAGASPPLHCGRQARIANTCGAEGPLQFLTGKDVNANKCTPKAVGLDVWSEWKGAVAEATGESRVPNICNPKDALYAAAKKLKAASGSPQTLKTWTRDQVFSAIRNWYGSCSPDTATQNRFGAGKSYCDFVWEAVTAQR